LALKGKRHPVVSCPKTQQASPSPLLSITLFYKNL